LDSKAASRDAVLCEAKLLEGSTSCNLDLCCDDIDTRDLFRDGVFDLAVALSDTTFFLFALVSWEALTFWG
jgi:hypothetical protein